MSKKPLQQTIDQLALLMDKKSTPSDTEKLRLLKAKNGATYRLFYLDPTVPSVPFSQHNQKRYVEIMTGEQNPNELHVGFGDNLATSHVLEGMIGFVYDITNLISMDEALTDIHVFLTQGIYPSAGHVKNIH